MLNHASVREHLGLLVRDQLEVVEVLIVNETPVIQLCTRKTEEKKVCKSAGSAVRVGEK